MFFYDYRDNENMQIQNKETVKQAIANNRLEGMSCSQEVLDLLKRAESDQKITTEYILEFLRNS